MTTTDHILDDLILLSEKLQALYFELVELGDAVSAMRVRNAGRELSGAIASLCKRNGRAA